MFLTTDHIESVATDLLPSFEVGNLNTRTPRRVVAAAAREALADRHLPTRRSLCYVVADVARVMWRATVIDTHRMMRAEDAAGGAA